MKSLIDEPHSFTLAELIAEYKSLIADEPSHIVDKDGDEHSSSIIARFKCYDE